MSLGYYRALMNQNTGFSPLDLDNQVLFWDFRDASSYSMSGGKVTSLIDLFGVTASTDFQSTGSATGLDVTGGKLILPANANQFFLSTESASYWDFLHDGSDWSVYFSFLSNQGNSAGVFFSNINFGSIPGLDVFLDNRTSLSRVEQLRYRVRGTSGNIVNNGLNNSFTNASLANVAANYDYTNATAGNPLVDIYKDGDTLTGSINLDSKTASATSAANALVFFCSISGGIPAGNSLIQGELKGLVITQDLLTTDEIGDLNTYFT